MSKRLVAMLVGVMTLAAVAFGCGDSDDEALTKAQFIRQGDAICKKVGTKRQDEYDKAATKYLEEGGKPSRARGEELAEQFLIPSRQEQLDRLRELAPPEDQEDEVDAMLETGEQAVEDAEEDPGTIFLAKTSAFAESEKLMADYGFKVCGTI